MTLATTPIGAMSYSDRRAFSKAECDRIRSQVREVTKRQERDTWELAECLYKIRECLDESTNEPIYRSWGYASFRHYCEAESPVSRTQSYRLAEVWARTQASIRSEKKRALAAATSPRKLGPVGGLLDEDNLETWCAFVSGHQYTEVRGARAVALRVPALRSDPEKALARFNRKTFRALPGSKTVTIAVTPKSQAAIDLSVVIMRRALKNPTLSAEQCVIKALEQFVRLAQSGRAGAGYTLPAVELEEAGPMSTTLPIGEGSG